jgi:hypothetical protein
MNDLEYRNNGLFTSFTPCTKQGEAAWLEIAAHTGGTGNVLSIHAQDTCQQLRAAGYTVGKGKKITLDILDDELLAELFA